MRRKREKKMAIITGGGVRNDRHRSGEGDQKSVVSGEL
jgi:hypothetical protein